MKNLDLNIFPQVNKEDWLQLAEKQLKGANPNEELAWKNDAEISLEGYYDQEDVKTLTHLADFFSTIPSHRWKLYERIDCTNAKLANQAALDALMGGCDGIILVNPDTTDLDVILNDVNADICDICMIGDERIDSTTTKIGFNLSPNGNCFATEKVNPVNQLIEILKSISEQTHIHRVAHADFFLEIAAIRALRFLLDKQGHKDVRIHSRIPRHASDEHQWFLNTTGGLASILGGSHSIDFTTATGDSRISRNTGNLIRDESGIVNYTDQCGGAYYIEVLTDKIVNQVTERLK